MAEVKDFDSNMADKGAGEVAWRDASELEIEGADSPIRTVRLAACPRGPRAR